MTFPPEIVENIISFVPKEESSYCSYVLAYIQEFILLICTQRISGGRHLLPR